MRMILTGALVLCASLAAANGPGLYTLNQDASRALRENPRATSALIDRLPDEVTTVEVTGLSENGDWARILHLEGNAWMPLEALTAMNVTGGPFENPLFCAGTEPFWSLKTQGDTLILEEMGAPAETFSDLTTMTSANTTTHHVAQSEGLTVLLRGAECSDGMSDRTYGLATDIILPRSDAGLLSGCCTLQSP